MGHADVVHQVGDDGRREMTEWIITVAIFVMLAVVAFIGMRFERDRQIRDRLEGLRDKVEIDNEVDQLSPADLDRRYKRWMRDG